MSHPQWNWTSRDGWLLYAQAWQPEGEARSAVCLVHGLGEHSGRYGHVAAALNRAGHALLAVDLRGHGRSTGRRGHIPSLEAVLDDIDLLLEEASRRFPGRPRFLYGHSMGGLFVLYYALRRRPSLSGVIATGSALRTPLADQKVKVTLARLLSRLLPALTLPSGLDPTTISRDPAVVQAYRNDPLVHDRISLRLAGEMLRASRWVMEHAAEFPLPLLLIHGGADRLTLPEGSRELAARVGNRCTLKIWEGLYHEVHNEPEQGEVLADILSWMEERLKVERL
ncbi:MAG: lysophospholipase [Chloroflexia bacterium]